MFTLSPSLTLNIGQRKAEAKSEKPAQLSVEKAIEPQKEPSTLPVAPLAHAPAAMHMDGFQFLLICLAIAIVLVAGAAFIYAARA